MKEQWKPVRDYEDLYHVSNHGRIRSFHARSKGAEVFPGMNEKGYKFMPLSRGGKLKNKRIARLVAEAFLPDWDEALEVDHINGIKTDNMASNLRMITHRQNCRSFTTTKRGATSKYRGVSWYKRDCKWKVDIGVNGKSMHVGYFTSEVEAAKAWDEKALSLGFSKEALNAV